MGMKHEPELNFDSIFSLVTSTAVTQTQVLTNLTEKEKKQDETSAKMTLFEFRISLLAGL